MGGGRDGCVMSIPRGGGGEKKVLAELLYAADKYQLTGLVSGNLTFKTNLSRFDPPKLVGPFYLANFSPPTISLSFSLLTLFRTFYSAHLIVCQRWPSKLS